MREWISMTLGWLGATAHSSELPGFMIQSAAVAVALTIAPAIGLVQSALPSLMGQSDRPAGHALANIDARAAVQSSKLTVIGVCASVEILTPFLCLISVSTWVRLVCLVLFFVAVVGTIWSFFSAVHWLRHGVWQQRFDFLSRCTDLAVLEEVFRELWTMPGAELGIHEEDLCSVFRAQMSSALRQRRGDWEGHFKKLLLPFMRYFEQRDSETKSSPGLLKDVLSWAQQLNQVRLSDNDSDAALLKDQCLQLCQLICHAGFRNCRSGDHARILGPAWAQHLDDPEGPCATAFLRFLDEGFDYLVETGDAVWIDVLPPEWIVSETNLSGSQSQFAQLLYSKFCMWLLPTFGSWTPPPDRLVTAVANELFLQANPQVVVDLMLAYCQAPSPPRNGLEQKSLVHIQFGQLYQARMFAISQINELHLLSTAAAMAIAEQNTFSLMAQLEPTLSKAADVRVMAERYERCLPDDRAGAHYAKLLLRLADFLDREG